MQIIDYLLLNQDINSLSCNQTVKQKLLIHLTYPSIFPLLSILLSVCLRVYFIVHCTSIENVS